MKKTLVLAFSVFLVVIIAGILSADTPLEFLVKIDLEDSRDVARLLDSRIVVVQNLGEFALARAGISDVALLNSMGYAVQVLDSDWGYADHYIVSLERCSEPERIGKVVYRDSDLAVVRRFMMPFTVPLAHDSKRLRTSPIKIRGNRTGDLDYVPDTLPDPLIQGMVDSVHSDTLEAYLRYLEGIGTRYSPTPGCSLAAEYIKANFEAAGLAAGLQSYTIGAMVSDVFCLDQSLAWAVDEAGGIFRSEDMGATWSVNYEHGLPLLSIFFCDSLLGWAVGAGDSVLHTTDGGASWYSQSSTGALEMTCCFFQDSLCGWISGAASDTTPVVYKTVDGGDNWVQSGQPFVGEFVGVTFADSLRGWAAGLNSTTESGIIYATGDGGATWTEQYDTTSTVFFKVCFWDTLRGWAAGGDFNTADPILVATTDGGQTWVPQVTGGWILFDVDFVDSLNGWCVGFGTVRRTTDGGASWAVQSPPAFDIFFTLDMLDTLGGMFGGGEGAICHTANGGAGWSLSNTGGVFRWYNVEAELPGVDMADEIYLICGHHDDTSEDPYNVAPGADDNASGVCAVLEAARILSQYQFHRTIRFVTFSGEEQGLLGSEFYASRAESLGENIRGVLNLDMIGYLDDSNHDLDVYCDLPSEWMADTILQFSAAYVPGLIPHKEVDPSMVYSDHSPFWDAGYSAVLHIERAFVRWNPYYHSTEDTVGTLDLPYVTEMVKLGVASTAELADPYVVGVSEETRRRAERGRLALSVLGSPFRGRVKLDVINTTPASASLEIYDASGRMVKRFGPAKGKRAFWWEGSDDSGGRLPSGVYLARLCAGREDLSVKLVLVR